MNFLVRQFGISDIGSVRLAHEEFPVCSNHLNVKLHMIIGNSADACWHCDAEMGTEWQTLLRRNTWLTEIKTGDAVYVSGPMTGVPDDNRPAFNRMAHALKLRGAKVVNPADNPKDWSYERNMRQDVKSLLEVTTIVMLRGWDKSRGALIEHSIAEVFNLRVFHELL